jgi:predicted RNA-binding protein with PIN domain
MAGQRLVVDGYNLVHKIPALKALVEGGLEQARDRLVLLLADHALRRNLAVTVVFDNRRGIAGTRGDSRAGVKVVFAQSDADSYIKRMLERERSPRSWTVVTSDNSIRRHVADFGARTMLSEDLAREIERGAVDAVRGARNGGQVEKLLGAAEVAEWEQWFKSRRPGFGEPPPRPARRPRAR